MRTLLSFLLILLSISAAGQLINKDTDLQATYKKITTPRFIEAPPLTRWAEGSNMLLICDKFDPGDCSQMLLALNDTTLIGAFDRTQPSHFLLDKEGTSVLNQRSDIFILPEWVVKRRTKISASDTTILSVLNEEYEVVLQADDIQDSEQTHLKLQRFQTDTTLANRHIALLFDNYQTIITETAVKGQQPPADICIELMSTLAYECYELFGRIPVIVHIYGGEALHSAGMINEARAHFKKALEQYPESVPLQVYNYRFEKNKDKQNRLLAQLKKDHPRHWMVKDL